MRVPDPKEPKSQATLEYDVRNSMDIRANRELHMAKFLSVEGRTISCTHFLVVHD